MENIVKIEMVLNIEEAVKNIKARVEATKVFKEVLAIIEKIEARKEALKVVESAIAEAEETVSEKEEEVKITGRLKRAKGIEEGNRVLSFYVKLSSKNGSLEDLENKFNSVMEYMENELGVVFTGYPYYQEEGEKEYADNFNIVYSHGDMKQLKRRIKKVWKKAKEMFGIK